MRQMRDDEPTNLPRIRRIQSLAEELGYLADDGEAQQTVIDKLLTEARELSERITRQRHITKRR
jgi:hypothetical protein